MDLQKKIHLLRKSILYFNCPNLDNPLTHPFSPLDPSSHLENDHKSNIELLEGSKKAQQEEIQRLKEAIQKLRAQLLRKVLLVFLSSGWPFSLHPVRPPIVLSLLL